MTTLVQTLRPFQTHFLTPAMRRTAAFWLWWTMQLESLLPNRIRNMFSGNDARLLIEPDGDDLRFVRGTLAQSEEVLRSDESSTDVSPVPDAKVLPAMLLLPKEKVLTRQIKLPCAAEENLREVLAFEMDKHTPLPASRLYFDHVITERDTARQELSVELVYSPRFIVDKFLERLSRHGVEADVITARTNSGPHVQAVNLLPEELRRNKRRPAQRLNAALALLVAGLLAVSVILPLNRKDALIAELQTRADAAYAAAKEGSELRQELEKMAEASRFLAAKKQSELRVVELINALSRQLPDHTWINRIDVTSTEIQLQGQSMESSALIGIIESSDYFENVKFLSPVVQVAGSDADRFHLSADIERGKQ